MQSCCSASAPLSLFMNRVLYAREGAKGIMDRTFVDFPWQVRVEVDGVEIEVLRMPKVHLLQILEATLAV
ncbi:unnamed protein product [Prunus armeniaca]|uniref:Uncharacterized protein n=1 Tax=Prunus armeniaca TaxID=36596 RepID=A0A6J5V067_PRUAR|nr:unnamed protein product [Prunus armeniaca]CAB4311475.1 unnamed protein product [Prunus armeniaca]